MLGPLGLRQKGRSRVWLDDHGWWLIAVEHLLQARGARVVRYAKPTFTKPAPAEIRVYNTLTRRKEPLRTIEPGKVRMYVGADSVEASSVDVGSVEVTSSPGMDSPSTVSLGPLISELDSPVSAVTV